MSAWLREAALRRAAEESEVTRIRTVDELRGFFSDCDAREVGREPEWEEHLAVLDASMHEGVGQPSEGRGPSGARRVVATGRGAGRRSTTRKRR